MSYVKKELELRILNLHAEGKTNTEIALLVGSKPKNVSYYISKNSLKANIVVPISAKEKLVLKLFEDGKTNIEIGEIVGIADNTVSYYLSKNGISRVQSNDDIENYEKRVIDLYHQGFNSVQTAEKLGYTKGYYKAIIRTLRSNGLEPNNSRLGLTQGDIENICELYENLYTQQEIQLMYSEVIACDHTINNIIRKSGIKPRRVGTRSSIMNHNYFHTIDSHKKAYFLGLIAADGCIVNAEHGPVVGLGLVDQDSYLIREFAREVEFTGKLYRRVRKDTELGHQDMINISFTSSQMASDLARFGVVPRKTGKEVLPSNILSKFMPSFIRGFFDGDGSVFLSNGRLRFSIYSNHNMCQQILDYFNFVDNSVYDYTHQDLSFFSIQKRSSVLKFYNCIYSNQDVYMKRKKDIFDTYYKNNNTHANTEVD